MPFVPAAFGNYFNATVSPVVQFLASHTKAHPPFPSKSILSKPLGHLSPYVYFSCSDKIQFVFFATYFWTNDYPGWFWWCSDIAGFLCFSMALFAGVLLEVIKGCCMFCESRLAFICDVFFLLNISWDEFGGWADPKALTCRVFARELLLMHLF